jgi:hypothetical protein
MAKTIQINCAPVLTLWGAVVAQRLGFRWDEALTLGKALAGHNAYSKGASLGLLLDPTRGEGFFKPRNCSGPYRLRRASNAHTPPPAPPLAALHAASMTLRWFSPARAGSRGMLRSSSGAAPRTKTCQTLRASTACPSETSCFRACPPPPSNA